MRVSTSEYINIFLFHMQEKEEEEPPASMEIDEVEEEKEEEDPERWPAEPEDVAVPTVTTNAAEVIGNGSYLYSF